MLDTMLEKKQDLFWGRVPPWALVLVAAVGTVVVYFGSDERDPLVTLVQFVFLLALLFGLRALGRWHQKRYGKDA